MGVQQINFRLAQVSNETTELRNCARAVKTFQGIGRYFAKIQLIYFGAKHSPGFQACQTDIVLSTFVQSPSLIQRLTLGAALVEAIYELKNAWQNYSNPVWNLTPVYILTVPKLEHQQRPQSHRVVAAAAFMFVEQQFDILARNVTALKSPWIV